MAALLILSACGQDNKTSSTATPTTSAPAPSTALDPKAVYLDGLYATSTAPGQDVNRLFDADPASGWRTLPGAGPDEGIMLYFSNATAVQIQSVRADALEGAALDSSSRIQIYVNGQPVRAAAPGERIDLHPEDGKNERVNSVFLRFSETILHDHKERSIPNEELDISTEIFA
ncbi:MAG TPA: hypothetical protein PLW66_08670, partial [Saprospiraceae bacterium]|nr:hypothetical protein [Saprospiraceae bacterium]